MQEAVCACGCDYVGKIKVERTKADKLFQMSRYNRLTVGKHLCQRGGSRRLLQDYGESQGFFLSLFSLFFPFFFFES